MTRYALSDFPPPAPADVRPVPPRGGGASTPGHESNLSRATLVFLRTGAPEGERNKRLFDAACDFAGNNLPMTQAESEIGDAGSRCGLDEEEIKTAIRSAYGKERLPARPPDPQSSPIEGGVRHDLSNVEDGWREKVGKPGRDGKVAAAVSEHYCIYKPIERIAAEILHAAGSWPKLLGSIPFVLRGEGLDSQVIHLADPASVFGWMHGTMDVRWHMGACEDGASGAARTPPTKPELHKYLAMGGGGVESFKTVTAYPQAPPIKGTYYTPVDLPPATGKTLDTFLGMLNPETEHDRKLMLSALLTCVWGGQPGTRPMFVFRAKSGVGSGKTSTAKALAAIFGGACQLDYQESWVDLAKSMFSSSNWNARVILFDNVKGQYGGSAIESVVTSATLSGWRAYVGTVERPNDATIFVTFNEPQLTRDMADRAVVINIGPPKHDKSFDHAAATFIAAHGLELLADLLAIMRAPVKEEIEVTHRDRWQLWQQEVLGRIDGGSELAGVICARRPEVDSDAEDAMKVARALLDKCDTHTGDITSYDIRAACRASGLWTDDKGKSDDKSVQRCLEWVKRVLSGRGVLDVCVGAGGKPMRRRVFGPNGEKLAYSVLYHVNRDAGEALDSDGDDIPV